jgi:hypothetical protein
MANVEQGSIDATGLASDTNLDILISLLDNYSVRVAVKSTDTKVTYVGFAVPGALVASAVWQIKSVDENTGTIVLFADGNDSFDNVWNNREALTYS